MAFFRKSRERSNRRAEALLALEAANNESERAIERNEREPSRENAAKMFARLGISGLRAADLLDCRR